jgi:hypothetical protein
MTLRQELDGETVIDGGRNGNHIRLDARGFTAYSGRHGQKGRTWDEVTGFQPANVTPGSPEGGFRSGAPMYQIGFFLRNPPKKGRIGRWLVRRSYGVDDTLPGLYPNAAEVVELMERWRQRHSSA